MADRRAGRHPDRVDHRADHIWIQLQEPNHNHHKQLVHHDDHTTAHHDDCATSHDDHRPANHDHCAPTHDDNGPAHDHDNNGPAGDHDHLLARRQVRRYEQMVGGVGGCLG
jgi:hypothetical protein